MTEPLAFLNGRLLSQPQASLALNDSGFVYGATVTDLCRTFRHRLFRFADHSRRFRGGCESCRIDLVFNDESIKEVAEHLVRHNADLIGPDEELALVMFATPGPIGHYLGQSTLPGEQPTFGMHTFRLPFERYRPWIEQGIHLATPNVRQIPAACISAGIKHRSRLHYWLAEQEVRKTNPGAVALLLDDKGHVTETASANLVVVHGCNLATPANALDGVSLAMVTELCQRLNIPLERRAISLNECLDADGLILTCTSYCIAGVNRLNDRHYNWPNPMLKRLIDAWSADVGLDIHQQIFPSPPVLRGRGVGGEGVRNP